MAKRIIFLRNNEALVKIEGAIGANTIDIDVDLLGANEVLNGQTVTVNITAVSWSGLPTGTFTISRGGANLVAGSGSGSLGSPSSFFENGSNTIDITVTTATAEMQVWIRLHKVSGFGTKIEPEQFGSYDNITTAGS
jgi:hypothetical protein